MSTRRSRAMWLLWAVAMVVGALWWSLYQSNWFTVVSVRVVGNRIVPTDAIVTLAAVQGGVPLVSVPTTQIAQELAQVPQIGTVRVERGWPHTVLITVSERIPVAVAHRGSKFQSVDETGVAAAPPQGTAPRGLTVIEGKPGTSAMAAAVAILQALPSEWKVTGLSAPTQDSVAVTLAGGGVITFGSGEQAQRKVQVATALLANKYHVIDVSAPDAPTVRP